MALGDGEWEQPYPYKKNIFKVLKVFCVLFFLALGLLVFRGFQAAQALNSIHDSTSVLKKAIAQADTSVLRSEFDSIASQSAIAHNATNYPLWKGAQYLPLIGETFRAVTAISDASYSLTQTIDPNTLDHLGNIHVLFTPKDGKFDLQALENLTVQTDKLAQVTKKSSLEISAINSNNLVEPLKSKFVSVQDQITQLNSGIENISTVVKLFPPMLGSEGPRHYIVLNQNNAELRGTGGLPGAITEVTAETGSLRTTGNMSLADFKPQDPPIVIDKSQTHMFSSRLGTLFSAVNLTPDFPTAAKTAHAMYHAQTGQELDGIFAIDPVALSYTLKATGPLKLDYTLKNLPAELTAENAVQTLLSDIYQHADPAGQDQYFAMVAEKMFARLQTGGFNAHELVKAGMKMSQEHRLLIWSNHDKEQKIIESTSVGGSTLKPTEAPSSFMYGVAINNIQQSKMDFYYKDKVQLVQKGCGVGGNNTTVVKVQVTNTAPADVSKLNDYITGGSGPGTSGNILGSIYDSIEAYGPKDTVISSVKVDGRDEFVAFGNPQNLPAASLSLRVQQGETKTVEFTFKGVDLTQKPALRLTPTVQPLESRREEPSIEATCE